MNDNIKIAGLEDIEDIVKMALELWPSYDYGELKEEYVGIIGSSKDDVLLYLADNNSVGFNHISIRSDYVEGCNSSPTGYIEGIFVKRHYRKKGIAKALVKEGENWVKEKGCKQMGSNVELHNTDSYHFHRSVGYKEVNRVICFLKDIG